MFIAMNTFYVNEDRCLEFEEIWQKRERYLSDVNGFLKFKMLKSESEKDGIRDYISHSTWESADSFWEWTKSDAFKMAHKNRTPAGILSGPPSFKGFNVLLEE